MSRFLAAFVLIVCCSLALAPAARAQDQASPPASSAGPPMSLTVHGHAEIKAMPDIAYVTVGITSQSRDQATASQQNATASAAVRSALTKAGIADRDIQTQFFTVAPQYDYNSSPPALTGYQATNSLRVTVRTLRDVGTVMDKAVTAGATNVGDIQFDLSDRHKVEGEALVDAISNARSKADLMAGAAGVKLGGLTALSEGAPARVTPIFSQGGFVRAAAMGSAQPPTQISPQEITVTADVTAQYGMLPSP